MCPHGSCTAHDRHDWLAETAAARKRAEVAARDCARRLSEALSELSTVDCGEDPELEASIVAYVRALKAQSLSPEQSLIAVKRVLAEAFPETEEYIRLKRSAVAWMIQAYYSGS